ncbi:radical SAM domain protein [Desulfosarcina variabilis str. Montpellier]
MVKCFLKTSYKFCGPGENLFFSVRLYNELFYIKPNYSMPNVLLRWFVVRVGDNLEENGSISLPQLKEVPGESFNHNYFYDFQIKFVASKIKGDYVLIMQVYEKVDGSIEGDNSQTLRERFSVVDIDQVPDPYRITFNKSMPNLPGTLIEVTNICNMKCDFCPSGRSRRKKGVMPKTTALKILEDIFSFSKVGGIGYHILGEPLMNKDLADIVEVVNNRFRSKSTITTNATLINEKFLKQVLPYDKLQMLISMQTFNDGEHFTGTYFNRDEFHQVVADMVEFHNKEQSPVKIRLSYLLNFNKKSSGGVKSLKNAQAVFDYWDHIAKKITGDQNRKQNKPQIKRLSDLDSYLYPSMGFEFLPNIFIFFKSAVMSWNWDVTPIIVDRAPPKNMPCPKHWHAPCVSWDGQFVMCCWDYDARTRVASYGERNYQEILSDYEYLMDQFVIGTPPFKFCSQCINSRI